MTVYERTLIEPEVEVPAARLDYAPPQVAPAPTPDWPRRLALIALLLITLLGGGLRFSSLDQPTIWGDEAATFRRTCGTYAELLDNLRSDGFTPLHYELYWWINQGMPLWAKSATVDEKITYDTALRLAPGRVTMGPVVMRLVPAIAGTLLVPAVYFFAVQVFDRRRALLAALLAAGSAYLLVYSRDAKMYMPLWLLATANAGCLLGWLRTVGHARRLYWWAWVASGVAMVGVHALGLFVPGLELLIVLTHPHPGHRRIGGAIGRTLAAPLLPLQACCAAVVRWTDGWDVDWWAERGGVGRRWQRTGETFRWPPLVPFLIGAAIIVAGPIGYYGHFNRYADKIYGDEGQQLDDPNFRRGSDLDWINAYNDGRDGSDLLLYTASAYLTGWEWPREVDQPQIAERTRVAMKAATGVLIGLLLLGLLPWRTAGRRIRRRAAGLPPTDDPPPRWRRVLWVAAWVALPLYVFYCMSMEGFSSPLYWPLAAIFDGPPVMKSLPAIGLPAWFGGDAMVAPGWWDRASNVFSQNWNSIVNAATAQNVRWLLLAGLTAAAVAGFFLCARTWRGRLPRLLATAAVVLIVFGLCVPIYLGLFIFRPTGGSSVWMPRYMGFIYPAMLIGMAALFTRLPTRPLRWGAVGLFLAVNLTQFAGRVYGGSEPPTDRIAADLVAAIPADPTAPAPQQTFVRMNFENNGAPGTGIMGTQAMRYFYVLKAHLKPGEDYGPEDIKNFWSPLERRYQPPLRGNFPYDRFVQAVARRANRPTSPKKVVVWQGLPRGRGWADDPVLTALNTGGNEWKLVDESIYPVRDHWTWRDLFTARRRAFERQDRPSTRPKGG